ncbi:MAG: hypothetical protein ACE5KH_01610 [Candidatus Geothermarchaeales archaeon]
MSVDRIPKDELVKVAQKNALNVKRNWKKEKLFGLLPNKDQKALLKRFGSLRAGGLERIVAKWMRDELGCDKTKTNVRIQGKLRKREIDVVGLKEGWLSDETFMAECKATKSKVSDRTLASIYAAVKDLLEGAEEDEDRSWWSDMGMAEKFYVVSTMGFTDPAKRGLAVEQGDRGWGMGWCLRTGRVDTLLRPGVSQGQVTEQHEVYPSHGQKHTGSLGLSIVSRPTIEKELVFRRKYPRRAESPRYCC